MKDNTQGLTMTEMRITIAQADNGFIVKLNEYGSGKKATRVCLDAAATVETVRELLADEEEPS